MIYSSAEEFYDVGSIVGYVSVLKFEEPLQGVEMLLRDYLQSQDVIHQVDVLSEFDIGFALKMSERAASDIIWRIIYRILDASPGRDVNFRVGVCPFTDLSDIFDGYKKAEQRSSKFSGRHERVNAA